MRTRWSQGATALEIARELGRGISRSSVLGKIRRLGIAALSPFGGGRDPRRVVGKIRRAPARATGYRIIDWRPRRDRPPPAWVAAAEPYVDDPLTDAGIPFSQRCSLLDLSECNCRWPVGEPGNAAFFYCGAEPVAGKPYCAAHCARAYRPPDEVVPRRPSARQRRCWAKNSGFWIRFSGETAAERKWGGEDQ